VLHSQIVNPIELLDVVALLFPAGEMPVGAVGTVVEVLESGWFIVEFITDDGETVALETLPADRLLKLRYDLAHAA
jgi:hypothetical protein